LVLNHIEHHQHLDFLEGLLYLLGLEEYFLIPHSHLTDLHHHLQIHHLHQSTDYLLLHHRLRLLLLKILNPLQKALVLWDKDFLLRQLLLELYGVLLRVL